MFDLQVAEEILDRIRERNEPYHAHAYLFVLGALEYCQGHRAVRGHLAGKELAWGCRDYARAQFGLTAPTVLRHWGVESTEDIGRIVYTLIDAGLLISQPDDRLEDFDGVFEFDAAFELEYPWLGANRSDGGT